MKWLFDCLCSDFIFQFFYLFSLQKNFWKHFFNLNNEKQNLNSYLGLDLS